MKIFQTPDIHEYNTYIYIYTHTHNLHATSTTVSFTTGLIIPRVMKLFSALHPTNES